MEAGRWIHVDSKNLLFDLLTSAVSVLLNGVNAPVDALRQQTLDFY